MVHVSKIIALLIGDQVVYQVVFQFPSKHWKNRISRPHHTIIMLWNVWPVPSVCPNNMPELSSPNCQISQSPAPTIFLILETHWAGTLTNPSTLCSYTLCFVCTVCNLAVLVYLLICLAKPFLRLLEANLCPRLSHLFELCTFLIIYIWRYFSLWTLLSQKWDPPHIQRTIRNSRNLRSTWHVTVNLCP